MRADDLTDGMRMLARTCGARLLGSVLVDANHDGYRLRLRLPNDTPDTYHVVIVPPVETFASLDAFMDSTMKVIDELVRKTTKRAAERPWSPYPEAP